MKSLGRFLIVFVLLSLPALAQNHDLTLFGGIQVPGNITLSNAASTGTSGVTQILSDPKDVGVFGLRYGSGRLWAHEETFAYTPSFLDSNSKSIILNSNLLIQAPLPVLKPYVTAGLGSVIAWGSGVSDLGSKFALNYGGGLKVRPAGPVGLRFDVRGYSIFSVQSQTLKMTEASVGILFGF